MEARERVAVFAILSAIICAESRTTQNQKHNITLSFKHCVHHTESESTMFADIFYFTIVLTCVFPRSFPVYFGHSDVTFVSLMMNAFKTYLIIISFIPCVWACAFALYIGLHQENRLYEEKHYSSGLNYPKLFFQGDILIPKNDDGM